MDNDDCLHMQHGLCYACIFDRCMKCNDWLMHVMIYWRTKFDDWLMCEILWMTWIYVNGCWTLKCECIVGLFEVCSTHAVGFRQMDEMINSLILDRQNLNAWFMQPYALWLWLECFFNSSLVMGRWWLKHRGFLMKQGWLSHDGLMLYYHDFPILDLNLKIANIGERSTGDYESMRRACPMWIVFP